VNAFKLLAGSSLLAFIIVAEAADITSNDTIVVTATRTETPIDDAIVPVSIISRDEIELSLATDLAELLRFEAGIDIGRSGGPGQVTSAFIRGTDSNHTLVLVDGVRINPGTIGGAAIHHVAPETIERIEIVKGARSALFGTDAIGGVINIITRRADDSYVDAALGLGSFDTRSGLVSAGTRGDRGEAGLTLNWQKSDGFAPRRDSELSRGYDNTSINLYGSRHLGSSDVSLRHWRTGGTVEYLDFFLAPVDQRFENRATALQVDTKFSDRLQSKLIASHIIDEIRQQQSPDFVDSDRVSFDWQLTHASEHHTLTGGVYLVDEHARSLSFGAGFAEDTRTRAVFLQDQLDFGTQRLFLALRLTDHESFGEQTTWNAEYAVDVARHWTLRGGIARSFRAPDATDRFGFGGDPDLDPELADSAQAGIRYMPSERHHFDLELYASNIDDLIDFDLATFRLANIDEAEIRGLQFGYEYRGALYSVRTSIVRQRADNAFTGERLLRRAEQSASVSVTRDIGAHRLGVSILGSGDREDFGGIRLESYVIANLTAQFALGRNWQLNARVENVADESYETAAGFRMQERSGYLELKYRWQ
jgi:vitamin B12 transporter